MRSAGNYSWPRWMFLWDVLLAIVFGIFVVFLLDIVTGGLFVSVVTVAALLAVFGAIQYLLWGRPLPRKIARASQARMAMEREVARAAEVEEFVLGLNESQRTELLRLLEQSAGDNSTGQAQSDRNRATVRRELAEKLRMFGA